MRQRENRHMFAACWVAYTATYLGRLNYSAVLGALALEGIFSKTQLGMVGTCFFASYGLGQLLMTILSRYFSARKGILFGMLGSAVCNLLFPMMTDPIPLYAVWAVNGLSQSCIWPFMIQLFAENLSPEKRMNACIHINTTVPVGTIAVYLLAGVFIAYGSWKWAFYAGAAALVLASCFWIVTFYQAAAEERTEKESVIWDRRKLSLPPVLILFCFAALIQGMLRDGVINWVPSMAIEQFSLPASAAVASTLLLPVVNLSGAYIARYLNHRIFKNEATVCVVLFLVGAFSTVLLNLPASEAWMMYLILSVATTCFLGINTMLVSVVPTYFAFMRATASISAFLNAAVYAGSTISGAGFGYLADAAGWKATRLIWAACGLIGALLCTASVASWRCFVDKQSVLHSKCE